MTPQHKNESDSGAERSKSNRPSFRDTMRKWLKSRRNDEALTEVRTHWREVFYEFQPEETATRTEVDETVYEIDSIVAKDIVLPRIGDRVVISNPSKESEYAFYYVMSQREDPGQMPRLQIDQVVLPTDENRLFSPAVSVFFDMPKPTMLDTLGLTDDGESWSLPQGTRIQRIMPLELTGSNSDADEGHDIEAEMSRLTIQSKYDSNRQELAKVLKELERPR